MKLVYVAGRYRAPTAWEVEQNVRRAEEVGMEVAKLGAAPLIPHSMNRFFSGTLTDEFWLASTMTMLERCDAIVLVSGWEFSAGARAELARAKELGKQICETVDDLRNWLEASFSSSVLGGDAITGPGETKHWLDSYIADMRSIGLLAEVCLGCRQADCDSCPCGTCMTVDHSKLSPEASVALYKLKGETKILDDRNSYRCVFCDKRAEKHRWGEGKIWCPGCGTQQPSPGELDDAKATCGTCLKGWRGCQCDGGCFLLSTDSSTLILSVRGFHFTVTRVL